MSLSIKRKENIFRELSFVTKIPEPLCYHLPRGGIYRICHQKEWQGKHKTQSIGIKEHNSFG